MNRFILILLFLFPTFLMSQDFIFMQNGTFNSCDGYFYDTDSNGVYQPNENYTITLCPTNGTYLTLDFLILDLGVGDILTIYNGNSTSAPVIGVFDNTSFPTVISSQAVGNSNGCLTITFTSDATLEGIGWAATIDCYAPCQEFDVVLDSLSHDTIPGGFIDICQDDTLRIWSHGNYYENNTWYNQTDNNVEFNWFLGTNFDSIIDQQNPVYPIDSVFGTKILVTATDSFGCESNPYELTLRVSTTPEFINLGLQNDTVCIGDINPLNFEVNTVEWTNTDPGFVAGTLALPDASTGIPGSYSSTLNFTMFSPGSTVTSLTNLINVWIDIEHSYLGDLSITLSCPNGSTTILKTFPGGGGNWLGQACDFVAGGIPGNGFIYDWPVNTTPTNALLVNGPTTLVPDFCTPAFSGNSKNAGTYTPVTPFTNLIGCPLNGTWSMTVVDNLGADDGTMFGWGINFDQSLYPSTTITYEPNIDTVILDIDSTIASIIPVTSDSVEILATTFDTVVNVGVSFIDDFGCNYDTLFSFYVRPPNDPVCCDAIPPVLQMIQIGCPGGSDGQIIADPVDSLGPPPFWYTWYDATGNVIHQTDSVFTNDTLVNLSVGTYSVEVRDSIGCIVSSSIAVTEVQAMQILPGGLIPTSCAGNYCDGQANANVFFGTSPYTYLWSSGETTQIATSLCSGTNIIQVIDARGCIDSATITINSPAPIQAVALGDTLICISNSAPLTAVGSGGTPPYTYNWQGGSSINQIYSPSPGITTTYQVKISDANNCPEDSASATVGVRPPMNSQVFVSDTICPGDTAELRIIPYGGDSTYSYAWANGATTQSIEVTPSFSQFYYVTLTDACGTQPAKVDSGWIQVGGYPRLRVRTSGDDTICLGDAHNMLANANGGDGKFSFSWDNGLGSGQLKSVVPNKTTTYSVTATDQCNTPAGVGQLTVHVGNFDDFNIWVDTAQKCDPAVFNFAVDSILPGANYEWNFGDGFTNRFPLDTFDLKLTDDGCNDVAIRVTTELGCVTTKRYDCFVEVLPKPVADFDFYPISPDVDEPVVNFSGITSDGSKWRWVINDDTVSGNQYFPYTFPDSGTYVINMEVFNDYGCKDSEEKPLIVYYTPTVFIPTGFTPNGDNNNETFGIIGEGIIAEDFKMEIYNRWGSLVFETQDITEHWNGKWNNSGDDASNGTYVYVIYYTLYNGLSQVKRGEINIIR